MGERVSKNCVNMSIRAWLQVVAIHAVFYGGGKGLFEIDVISLYNPKWEELRS